MPIRKRTLNVKFWPKERIQHIKAMARKGHSNVAIAKHIGCDDRVIAGIVNGTYKDAATRPPPARIRRDVDTLQRETLDTLRVLVMHIENINALLSELVRSINRP